jgi:ribonuclease Z
MTFEVTILGCGAAAPTGKHNPSSQVVNVHDKLFMVDCGEGTQLQLRKFKIRFQRINHVFISHLHGDHYLGLMGFISSMHLLGRKTKLTIFGPPDLREIIDIQLRASQTFLEYPLEFIPTSFDEKRLIYEDRSLMVYSFPLKHRIDCCGFQFMEKEKKPKIKKEIARSCNLLPSNIVALKNGQETTLEDGTMLSADDATLPADPVRSYSYCSDTAFAEKVATSVSGSNLLYHESTFLESERERAKTTFHSTAKQAAEIAVKSGSKYLILGHFSSRYANDDDFRREAIEIFGKVAIADEGLVFQVPYS